MSVLVVRIRRWAGLSALLVLPLLAGCAGFFPKTTSTTSTGTGSGGTTTSNTGDYAYVASSFLSGSTAIYTLTGFSVGSGALAKLSGFPVTLPFAPITTAITPANTYLYVGGQGSIYGYAISSTGALTQLGSNGSVILATANVVAMDISPDGQWLFALDSNGSTIDEYQIQANGLLAPTTGTAYAVASGTPVVPSGIRVSKNPNNAYLAVALGTGGDLLYTLNTSTGGITFVTAVPPPTTSTADQAVTFDASGATLYVARSGTYGGLVPFAIGQGGTLTAVSGAPFALGAGPSSIVIDSTGKYVYVGNKVSGTISGFSIGSGGVLTALSGSPYASGSGVASLGRDNSGTYLLAAAVNGGPDVQMYTFDSTTPGKLDPSGTAFTGNPIEPAGALSVALTH
ncbi:MAG TPA: beta-propeller fold lactonase family protein [Granulicella sp.]|jgi:6-phosphogluconolactonase|nr:beta-propeller fold lactonase family protein [Granulicella sp.]